MKKSKKNILTMIICIALALFAYYAWKFPFMSGKYMPLAVVVLLSIFGILICLSVRGMMYRADGKNRYSRRNHGKGHRIITPKLSLFMAARWVVMMVFFVIMIWGGLIFGMKMENINIPVLACPWNSSQMTEASCYYLAHLNELFELPLKTILIFFASTIGFTLIFGRAVCGFLCPLGLIQDITDKVRQFFSVEGIKADEKMYDALVPIKWVLILLMTGLCFAGGNFCNFCPAIAVSPVLAGVSTSLYVSGFLMIFVIIGGFFKRRLWCNVCPLGYMVGFFHRFSLFRIKKDTTACTECGACYEACPMGIKTILTERDKTDVTDASCIMCGECVRRCPEDNGLSVTFGGLKLYSASREKYMSGYRRGS
jgi:polyferredoxin